MLADCIELDPLDHEDTGHGKITKCMQNINQWFSNLHQSSFWSNSELGFTVGELKDLTLYRAYGVKLP